MPVLHQGVAMCCSEVYWSALWNLRVGRMTQLVCISVKQHSTSKQEHQNLEDLVG